MVCYKHSTKREKDIDKWRGGLREGKGKLRDKGPGAAGSLVESHLCRHS